MTAVAGLTEDAIAACIAGFGGTGFGGTGKPINVLVLTSERLRTDQNVNRRCVGKRSLLLISQLEKLIT
jgi:hypothetical protein